VEGVDDAARTGTWSWKGIPFANPPVGDLRWKAPQEPSPWKGTLAAKAFREASVQFGSLFGPGLNNTYDDTIAATLRQTVGSEDSLYLNIWRPADGDTGLPVICFFHGGANVFGYTADPTYDGAALARRAHAVVVTASYRLGFFGWLAMPKANGGYEPGNYGTLDQIQALRFIQGNIARFGGDSGNVTVMGESAGACDLLILMTSPLAVAERPRLFHRAVVLSGGLALRSELPLGGRPWVEDAASAKEQGARLLQALLLDEGRASNPEAADALVASWKDGQIGAYLRAQTPEAILKAWLTKVRLTGMIPDGIVVADTPLGAIRAGNYLKVPILLGNTSEEGKLEQRLNVDRASLFRMLASFDPDAPPAVKAEDILDFGPLPEYAPTGPKALWRHITEREFFDNRQVLLEALGPKQANIWVCRFAWNQEPAPWNFVYGAAHFFDMPFYFGNWGPGVFSRAIASKANEAGRLALSDAMMGALAAFARTGNPNNPRLGLAWPTWPKELVFDATLEEKKLSVH
jgi:para-nitrobenzyl esterase